MTAEVQPYVADLVATRLAPYQAAGKQYAVDYHLGAVLAFYNKDLLDAGGVDPASIKTWDDYIAAGKKVQAAKPDVNFAAIDITGVIPVRSLMLQAGAACATRAANHELGGERHGAELHRRLSTRTRSRCLLGRQQRPARTSSPRCRPVALGWMPQATTRFLDNMESLCGQGYRPCRPSRAASSPRPCRAGTAVTDQPADRQLAKDFVTWAKRPLSAVDLDRSRLRHPDGRLRRSGVPQAGPVLQQPSHSTSSRASPVASHPGPACPQAGLHGEHAHQRRAVNKVDPRG
jgi:hypothetical protein